MKKRMTLFGLLLAGALHAQTTFVADWQNVSYSSSSLGAQLGGVALAKDINTGDIFTIGSFKNSITIGSFSLTSTGGEDVYVAKFNSSGVCLKAVKLGSASDDLPYSITFDAGTGATLDPYVSWYNGDGTTGGGSVTRLENDSSSLSTVSTLNLGLNVFPRAIGAYHTRIQVAGSYLGDAYLPKDGGGTIHLVPSNAASGSFYDCFVATYKPSTNGITKAIQPNYSTSDNEIMGIFVANHRVYCTGYFKEDLKWATGSTTATASGGQDIFVASVAISTSTEDIYVYATDLMRAGTTETGTTLNDRDCGYGITLNATAIYVTGNLSNASTPTFGSTSMTGCGAGAFVSRINFALSNSVGAVSWVQAGFDCATHTGPIEASIGYGIAVDGNGDIFATGQAYNYTGMKPSFCVSGTGQPGFLAKLNASGTVLRQEAINHTTNLGTITTGKAILVSGCNVYHTGLTLSSSAGQFSAGNLTPASTTTNTAMYLARMNRDASISSNITICAACPSGFPLSFGLTSDGGSGSGYSWSPATYLSSTTVSNPIFTMSSCGSTNTVYTNTMTGGSCPATATVTVKAGTSATGMANAGPDKLICPGGTVTLGTPAVAGLSYSWVPNTMLTGANTAQPVFSAPVSGLPMTVTVTVTDVCGNTSTDQVQVSWDPLCPRERLGKKQPAQTAVKDIYPNPSAGTFNLVLEASEKEAAATIEITDVSGRLILQESHITSGGIWPIDLSAQAKGVYILKVAYKGVSEIHKLIRE